MDGMVLVLSQDLWRAYEAEIELQESFRVPLPEGVVFEGRPIKVLINSNAKDVAYYLPSSEVNFNE
jgi:hypothetical protein